VGDMGDVGVTTCLFDICFGGSCLDNVFWSNKLSNLALFISSNLDSGDFIFDWS
jgi:hypothetical protein